MCVPTACCTPGLRCCVLVCAGLQEEQRELANTIRVSGSILLSTVSNFLDFFKLEAVSAALGRVRLAGLVARTKATTAVGPGPGQARHGICSLCLQSHVAFKTCHAHGSMVCAARLPPGGTSSRHIHCPAPAPPSRLSP